MPSKTAISWPDNYRLKPNEQALTHVSEPTGQLERALANVGRSSSRVPGFLMQPHEAIEDVFDELVALSKAFGFKVRILGGR